MSTNSRLDRLERTISEGDNQDRPVEPVGPKIDYDALASDLDEHCMARARRMLARGDIPILSDDEIAAMEPKTLPDGSPDYDKIGPYLDALYLAKVAANQQPPTAGDARQKDQR